MDKKDPATDDSVRERLSSGRWTLGAAALILTIVAFRAPDTLAIAVVGFLFIAIATIVFPRRAQTPPRTGTAPQRNSVWPGGEMKAMCEALSFPAYIIDRGSALRYANNAAVQAFGPAKIGDPISFKFRMPEIVSLISDAIAAGEPRSMEYHDQIPPDRWFWLSVTPVPKPGPDAMFDFHLVSFVDLTGTKRVEQMRSDFIANASHELRTPLASLRGFIETIKGPAASDAKASRQFLDLMLEQAERMARLVDDLLSLSRIEMKAHVRPSGEVELGEMLRHIRDTLSPLARKSGMKIELELPPRKLTVSGDRDELIQVFENLLENACKYGQSGKLVRIVGTLERDGNTQSRVVIAVEDFGPGIAAEHLPRLTERFYRVDVESSREKQGTGLGLAIVKHILARHGTRLSVSSQPGKGATFSVAFRLSNSAGSVEERVITQELQ